MENSPELKASLAELSGFITGERGVLLKLRADHAKLRDTVARAQEKPESGEVERIAIRALTVLTAEDEVLFSALARRGDTLPMVRGVRERVRGLREQARQLRLETQIEPESAMLHDFMEALLRFLDRDERVLFDAASEAFNDRRLQRLETQYEDHKRVVGLSEAGQAVRGEPIE